MQENVIGDNNNRNLGVAYYDYKPKPAIKALSFFNKLFSGKYKSADDQVIVTRSAGSESVVHSFMMEDGSWIMTAWLKTTDYGDRKKDNPGEVKDTRSEKIDLSLPAKAGGKALLYDEIGNSKDLKLTRNNGHIIIDDLELRGGKVAVIKIVK